jgi:hypothetical protein
MFAVRHPLPAQRTFYTALAKITRFPDFAALSASWNGIISLFINDLT